MDNIQAEEKLIESAKQLTENVILPDQLAYTPTPTYTRNYRKTFVTKFAVAFACVVLLLTTTGFMLAGNLFFVPGLGAVKADTTQITHSMTGITEVEVNGYTHKIILGYIKNNRVYMEIFYFKTGVGLTFDSQYDLSVDPESLEWTFGQPVDYEVYCNGEKGINYTKLYGTSISISYELPSVQKGEVTTVSLYSGETFISDILFYPVEQFSESVLSVPYAENNDIILTANVDKKEDYIEIYIGALLPEDAFREENMLPASVNGQEFGFSESEVLLRDSNGALYTHKADSSNAEPWKDEDTFLMKGWHFYRFDIPEELHSFTIVIPEIMYFCGDENTVDFRTVSGPWEIPIDLNENQ